MEDFWQAAQQPFVWGLAVGLLLAAFAWWNGMTSKRSVKRELKQVRAEHRELQGHLNTTMKISASGNDQLQKELTAIKSQNENLRVSLSTLQQKPGRAEIRHLHVLEGAVRRMREQAPGFASVWEQAVRQSTADEEAAESGFSKLVRKVLPSSETASVRVDDSRTALKDKSSESSQS
ncbi:MAG: hypothetical protein WA771_13725 [Chthoniobacterales bacterium]